MHKIRGQKFLYAYENHKFQWDTFIDTQHYDEDEFEDRFSIPLELFLPVEESIDEDSHDNSNEPSIRKSFPVSWIFDTLDFTNLSNSQGYIDPIFSSSRFYNNSWCFLLLIP